MRTALILLLMLAVASVAGSLVPQVGVADARIASMVRDHPLRAEIYQRLGLFNVYGSWWFTFIYGLLLVSLVACLLPRTRALVRNLRARPQPMRELDALRHHARINLPVSSEAALARARTLLRRRRYGINRDGIGGDGLGSTLAAEKGLAREAGSLLFHWSIFVILLGVAIGKGTGFTGYAVIVEGEDWVEAHANYDGQVREGRFFTEQHTGVGVHLREFTVRYRADTSPADFLSELELTSPDGTEREAVDLRVNHPAKFGGVTLYQSAYGWAPVIEVAKDGQEIFSGPVPFRQSRADPGVDPRALPWQGVVKLPSIDPQVGLELDLWPDLRGLILSLDTGQLLPMLESYRPVILVRAYRGDLGLVAPQRSAVLDKSGLELWNTEAVGVGERIGLGDGVTVSFPELREYTVLFVARDRGAPIVLGGAVVMLGALLPALYSGRRKVWVRAEPNGEGSTLTVGGFALTHQERFQEEFHRLVMDLERVR